MEIDNAMLKRAIAIYDRRNKLIKKFCEFYNLKYIDQDLSFIICEYDNTKIVLKLDTYSEYLNNFFNNDEELYIKIYIPMKNKQTQVPNNEFYFLPEYVNNEWFVTMIRIKMDGSFHICETLDVINESIIRLNYNDCTLNELKLKKLDNSVKKITHIANALKYNTYLQVLDISYTKMNRKCVKQISNIIQNNTSLKKLYIKNNEINDYGARKIAYALRINTSLIELDISENKISNKGAKEIANALKINGTLKILNIRWNNIYDENNCEIIESLNYNYALEQFIGINCGDLLSEENRNLRRRFLITKSSNKN